ncbi:MAG: hypothetical protein IJ374_05585 [Lachnospiraceae bacterium]|nr:hypothetical protein [Lachnospiraceae bacterium]
MVVVIENKMWYNFRKEYMQVDIVIDQLTDCLVERKTGAIVETQFFRIEGPIDKKRYIGWKFNWSETQKDGYAIYELYRKGSKVVEGRISLRMDGGVADVDIVEVAPHNFGHRGKYVGVGAHLFAIACQISFESGCDGFVAFTAKTNLVDYYSKTLNAKVSAGRRMYLDEKAARVLLDKYMRK